MLDFDEILANVKNPQIKKYIEESIKSYQVGNYRSAILAVWIAAMFDLVKKFEVLVDQREPTAIGKWNDLKPKIEDHKNWENELIGAAEAAAMISRYEADTLKALSKTRNRYAHPSFDDVGTLFDPTPEEVRYFIRTLYDIVLSQPAQLGAFYVSQLLESLKAPNFFPDRLFADELAELKDNVVEKINRINFKQIPRLIKELFKALGSPTSEEHELNIICFLANIWGAKSELQIPSEISSYWNDYILDKELNLRALEAILSYPHCINELSEQAQQKIGIAFKAQIFNRRRSSESAIKFLAAADIVPLAQSMLDEASSLIPLDKILEQGGHYTYLFGDKFAPLFGKDILNETQRALKTRDWDQINRALSLLRECGIWDLANTLSPMEQETFANALIVSLTDNTWETMNLLGFKNRNEVPIRWVKLLLEQWSMQLDKDPRDRKRLPYYLEHYLSLVERYINELENYAKLGESVQIVVKVISEDSHASKRVSKLESNENLWIFWQELLKKYSVEQPYNNPVGAD
jgi:hypothetical protein